MTMLAEDYECVIGADRHRDTIDLAVLDTATGRTLAHLAAADGPVRPDAGLGEPARAQPSGERFP